MSILGFFRIITLRTLMQSSQRCEIGVLAHDANNVIKESVIWYEELNHYTCDLAEEFPGMLRMFLRYFQFICNIICYRHDRSPQGRSKDEFDLLQEYFTGGREQVMENVSMIESCFDCWCSIAGYPNPSAFLHAVISHTHEDGKILVDLCDRIDIFEDCLCSYADKSGRTRIFHWTGSCFYTLSSATFVMYSMLARTNSEGGSGS